MTAGEWGRLAASRLIAADAIDAEADADWLLCEALGAGRGALARLDRVQLGERESASLAGWLARRESGEPLQYVLGYVEFMGIRFKCDGRALIPRMDTEALCEKAIAFLAERGGSRSALDLCAGGGAIGLAVKRALPSISVVLSDVDPRAISLARENAESLRLDAEFAVGDLFLPVAGRRFDAVLCNPPYVRSGDMASLPREVLAEPAIALDGGRDGMDFYRRVADGLPDFLAPSGAAFLEVGDGLADDVARMMGRVGEVSIYSDLSGARRVVAVYSGGG